MAASPKEPRLPKVVSTGERWTRATVDDPALYREFGDQDECPFDEADPFTVFAEWAGEIDDADYADL